MLARAQVESQTQVQDRMQAGKHLAPVQAHDQGKPSSRFSGGLRLAFERSSENAPGLLRTQLQGELAPPLRSQQDCVGKIITVRFADVTEIAPMIVHKEQLPHLLYSSRGRLRERKRQRKFH